MESIREIANNADKSVTGERYPAAMAEYQFADTPERKKWGLTKSIDHSMYWYADTFMNSIRSKSPAHDPYNA